MDNPVRIVIIDSGIYTSRSDLKKYVFKNMGFKTNHEGYIIMDPDMEVMHEHGTGIALIIRHLCPQIEIISINILNERLTTDARIMLRAMTEAIKLKPDIIHMSLGTTNKRYKKPIRRLVDQARDEDILVVSAYHNEGLESYPAYTEGVIGVAASPNYDGMICNRKGMFHAPPVSKDIWRQGEMENTNVAGTSISAAYVTGCLAALIKSNKYKSNKEVLIKFENIACKGVFIDSFLSIKVYLKNDEGGI